MNKERSATLLTIAALLVSCGTGLPDEKIVARMLVEQAAMPSHCALNSVRVFHEDKGYSPDYTNVYRVTMDPDFVQKWRVGVKADAAW